MEYREVEISTLDKGIEYITLVLSEIGIMETVIDSNETASEILNKKDSFHWDYVDEKAFSNKIGVGEESKITFYLSCGEDGDILYDKVITAIKRIKTDKNHSLGSLEIHSRIVNDEDWINVYKSTLKPIFITDNIVIKPTWIEGDEFAGKTVIELDPGMAFGTGDHETTSMCGILMDKYGCKGKSVLDVGTGSGILSILAAKKGAIHVKGIDIDEIAIDVSKENAKLNKCEDVVDFSVGDLTKGIQYKADIVVANLMAELVVLLSSAVKNHMKEDGIFISSGILLEKEEMVKDALTSNSLKIIEVIYQGEWCAIVAKSL